MFRHGVAPNLFPADGKQVFYCVSHPAMDWEAAFTFRDLNVSFVIKKMDIDQAVIPVCVIPLCNVLLWNRSGGIRGFSAHKNRARDLADRKSRAIRSVPGMAQFLQVKVLPRVYTAKCSEPQAAASNDRRGGSGVAKPVSLRTEIG